MAYRFSPGLFLLQKLNSKFFVHQTTERPNSIQQYGSIRRTWYLHPRDGISCPANYSGPDYASIPWGNMSTKDARTTHVGGYCGIKGPHPRMAICCQTGMDQPTSFPNAPIYLAEADHCSQYCPFFPSDLDLWLYCLTQEGHTVSNAFCRFLNGSYLDTSGSLPRDGPFDPNSRLIQEKKKMYSSANFSATVPKMWQITLVLMAILRLTSLL